MARRIGGLAGADAAWALTHFLGAVGQTKNGSPTTMASADDRRLLTVKLFHTVVWAFFAGCIVAIPIMGWRGRLVAASVLCGVVFIEVLILLFNGWRCPLTPIAAQYTPERRHNFDIFLPEWLARYNKEIFGTLYVAGLIYVAYLWLR